MNFLIIFPSLKNLLNMTKSQFQVKLKQLRKNRKLGEVYEEIAKKTGYSAKTVERANGNGVVDASKRFYDTFKLKYINNK